MTTSLEQLYATRLQKLEEQKTLSDRLNTMLTKPNGLNESTKCELKNLQAAIAVAKQPGYFEYYIPPSEVKQIEDQKVLNSLARAIQKLGKELEQLGSEIHSLEVRHHVPPQREDFAPNSLSQWFDLNGGQPRDGGNKEQITQFMPSARVYGGSAHHRAFKSQSSVLKKGRITR